MTLCAIAPTACARGNIRAADEELVRATSALALGPFPVPVRASLHFCTYHTEMTAAADVLASFFVHI